MVLLSNQINQIELRTLAVLRTQVLIPTKPADLGSFMDTFPAGENNTKLRTLAVLRTLFGCLKFGAFRTADLGSSTDTPTELLYLGSSTDTFPSGEKMCIFVDFFLARWKSVRKTA